MLHASLYVFLCKRDTSRDAGRGAGRDTGRDTGGVERNRRWERERSSRNGVAKKIMSKLKYYLPRPPKSSPPSTSQTNKLINSSFLHPNTS